MILLKKIASCILLVAILAQHFSLLLVRLDFFINRSYIAANLCENRNRPELHCNGKCILSQRLKQQQKKESQEAEKKAMEKSEISSFHSFHLQLAAPEPLPRQYVLVSDNSTTDRAALIFHPPSA